MMEIDRVKVDISRDYLQEEYIILEHGKNSRKYGRNSRKFSAITVFRCTNCHCLYVVNTGWEKIKCPECLTVNKRAEI